MAGQPRTLRFVLFAVLLGPAIAAEPAATETAAPPKRSPALSPHLASALASSLPAYDPAKHAAPAPAPLNDADQPHNTIIRLPNYIVRSTRPPDPEDILTEKGREADATKRYLGPQGNLDRTLNAVTLTDLWRSIPVLGKIPFIPFGSVNDGQRALMIYGRIEDKRRFAELLDIEATARKLEKEEAKPAASPKN